VIGRIAPKLATVVSIHANDPCRLKLLQMDNNAHLYFKTRYVIQGFALFSVQSPHSVRGVLAHRSVDGGTKFDLGLSLNMKIPLYIAVPF
jgi:hypothetical protein